MVRAILLILGLSFSTTLFAAGGGGSDEPPSTYLELEPDFVVNIGEPTDDGRSYVKAEITLRFHEASIREKAEDHEPWLRHELVMLLSGQPVDRMRSADGQDALRSEAQTVLNERLKKEMPEVTESVSDKDQNGDGEGTEEGDAEEGDKKSGTKGMIREVLFPNFIVQAR